MRASYEARQYHPEEDDFVKTSVRLSGGPGRYIIDHAHEDGVSGGDYQEHRSALYRWGGAALVDFEHRTPPDSKGLDDPRQPGHQKDIDYPFATVQALGGREGLLATAPLQMALEEAASFKNVVLEGSPQQVKLIQEDSGFPFAELTLQSDGAFWKKGDNAAVFISSKDYEALAMSITDLAQEKGLASFDVRPPHDVVAILKMSSGDQVLGLEVDEGGGRVFMNPLSTEDRLRRPSLDQDQALEPMTEGPWSAMAKAHFAQEVAYAQSQQCVVSLDASPGVSALQEIYKIGSMEEVGKQLMVHEEINAAVEEHRLRATGGLQQVFLQTPQGESLGSLDFTKDQVEWKVSSAVQKWHEGAGRRIGLDDHQDLLTLIPDVLKAADDIEKGPQMVQNRAKMFMDMVEALKAKPKDAKEKQAALYEVAPKIQKDLAAGKLPSADSGLKAAVRYWDDRAQGKSTLHSELRRFAAKFQDQR